MMDKFHVGIMGPLGSFFLKSLFTSFIITSLCKGKLTDVTTIYQVQPNSNSDPSNEPINPQCHVFIHVGSESKYLPYFIDNEVVFPKVSLIRNSQNGGIVKTSSVDQNLNDALLFDSNNHTNTRWTFDGTSYRMSELTTTHSIHDEPLYSRLIKKIRVKFILNDKDYENLKGIVANKSGKASTTSTEETASTAAIPDIIQQSELFHYQCKACRVDLYKLNKESGWDLKLMGNFHYLKEDSIERSVEYEDYIDFTDGGQSQSHTILVHNSTIPDTKQTVRSYRRSNSGQSDESSAEEISLPYTNQILFTYNPDNENGAILKPKLNFKEEAKYVLKVNFNVQSYFKTAFLVNNSTDKDEYDLIEITVRGVCEDVSKPYYVDISTGSDFRSWLINGTDARYQTITFLFKSREYVYMQVGLVEYTIELHGARLSQVETVPICFDNGFSTFQYELYDSTFSYFSLVSDETKFSSLSAAADTPSLTSPWIVPGENELCLTILYSGATSDWSAYEYECYNDNDMSQEISVKVEQKLGQVTTKSDTLPYCVERNGQFVRMIFKHKENLMNGRPPEGYRFLVYLSLMVKLRFIYASNCAQDYVYAVNISKDSCDTIEKVAYDVAYHHNYNKRVRDVQYCVNQGKFVQGSCVCPPGFYGDHCEEACGENKFGADCSGQCPTNPTNNVISVVPSLSLSATKSSFCQGSQCGNNTFDSVARSPSCQGALLCTHYGCVCAPGYRGKYCTQHCDQGYYGNDCKSRCGQCARNTPCNIYTGHCSEGCATPYLIAPYCQQSYPYVIKPLHILNTTHFSVLLRVDAHPKYIKGYSEDHNTSYWFHIQGQSLTWNTTHSSNKFLLDFSDLNSTSRDVWIENLIPGDQYSFQILLYDKDNRTHDPHDAPVTNVTTDCIHSDYEYAFQTETTSTSIQLSWWVRNINYADLMNRSIEKLKTVYGKELARVTTVDTLNRLLIKYNTSLEDVEELFKVKVNIVYNVFECKRRKYNARVRKINGQRGQKVKIKNIQSGFQIKHLDPGHDYFVNLYWEDNNRTMKDIFKGNLRTKNEVSEIPFRSVEKGNRFSIKWNSTAPRYDKIKLSKSESRTNPSSRNSKTKPSEPIQTVYFIKYRINQQQACLNKSFNDNWNVLATTKTEYELELNYFTKYSVFITLNKGQTWATKYVNISVAANVPVIAPNLLHVRDITDHSARLAWADISLSNYECARLNGVFTEYELEVIDLVKNTISVYNQTSGVSQEVDGLTPRTEYGVKLRYVNHYGKNPAVFAYVQFETL
ncbi:hypothetical protein WDU94_006999 [Cyamophila willieti]